MTVEEEYKRTLPWPKSAIYIAQLPSAISRCAHCNARIVADIWWSDPKYDAYFCGSKCMRGHFYAVQRLSNYLRSATSGAF